MPTIKSYDNISIESDDDFSTYAYICFDAPYYKSNDHTFSFDREVSSSNYEHADSQIYWHEIDSSNPGTYISLYDTQGKWNKYPNIYISGEINAGPLSIQGGAYGDINGKQNTETILTYATAQSNWRTASKIKNNSGNKYTPAACCCWRYHTLGTSQGDWYLPAAGEMAMVITNAGQIAQKLYQILTVYPNYCMNSNSIALSSLTSTERSAKVYSYSDYFNVYYGYSSLSSNENGNYGYIRSISRDSSYSVLAMLSYDFL